MSVNFATASYPILYMVCPLQDLSLSPATPNRKGHHISVAFLRCVFFLEYLLIYRIVYNFTNNSFLGFIVDLFRSHNQFIFYHCKKVLLLLKKSAVQYFPCDTFFPTYFRFSLPSFFEKYFFFVSEWRSVGNRYFFVSVMGVLFHIRMP